MGAYLKGFLVACQGIPATVFVSVLSVIIGSAAGLLLALMRTSKSKVLNWISKVYVDIVRGTPMVVQALIFAYGIPQFMQAHVLYFKWANLIIPAIIVCGLNSAAYMSEVIRSGIQAVDKGQMEAARSLGLSNWQAMRLVILPQAMKNSLPALISEFIALLKETSVVGWIGLNDIMRGADNIRFQTATAFQSLFAAAVMYLVLTAIFTRVMARVERKLKHDDDQR